MPIYDFFCEKCDNAREVFITVREYDARQGEHLPFPCPVCGDDMNRIPTKASFTLSAKKGFHGSKPKP